MRPLTLHATILVIAAALAGLAGVGGLRSRAPDEWARLVETGDALVARGGPAGAAPGAPTPRVAYLLAFHRAQDALDLPRMAIALARLERIGEHGVVAQFRELVPELGAGRAPPP